MIDTHFVSRAIGVRSASFADPITVALAIPRRATRRIDRLIVVFFHAASARIGGAFVFVVVIGRVVFENAGQFRGIARVRRT